MADTSSSSSSSLCTSRASSRSHSMSSSRTSTTTHDLHGPDDQTLTQSLDNLIEDAEHNTQQDNALIDPIDEDHPTGPQVLPPVVIVEGFFSFFHRRLWGAFDKYLNVFRESLGRNEHRKIILSRVGPVSSMHDRACELYYSIKGGTVDYGESHAQQCKHNRYGRHYTTGSYPSWSRQHPVHFVAHSLGGTTVTVMQQLIKEGHFGLDSHPDMVASVTAVSSPFKGTGYSFMLGEDRKCAPNVDYFSINSFIVRSVHTLSYFSPLIPSWIPLPDWHRDARPLTMNQISFWDYLKQMWRSDWGETKDVISFDATFEGSVASNEMWTKANPGPGTYYRSYVTCMTRRQSPETTRHICSWNTDVLESMFLYHFAGVLGSFEYRSIRPMPSFLRPQPPSKRQLSQSTGGSGPGSSRELGRGEDEKDGDGDEELEGGVMKKYRHGRTGAKVQLPEEYYANDGVVPIFSQSHPGDCSLSHCIHHSEINDKIPKKPFYFGGDTLSNGTSNHLSSNARPKPIPGIWNVSYVPDSTHVSIMPLWRNTTRQQQFWCELGQWLEDVDMARTQQGNDDDDDRTVVKSNGEWNGKGKGKEKEGA